MTRLPWIVGLVQTLVVIGCGAGIVERWFPLGMPGEWEWLRLADSVRVDWVPFGLAALAVVAFAGFAGLGVRSLGRAPSVGREFAWVAALAGAAVLVQGVVQEGAPQGYGLAKWIIALQSSGSSGYHTVARREMPHGLGAFLRDYPAWIERQDSLHIGTHPPGLFVIARGLDDLTRSYPGLARWAVDHAPGSAESAVRAIRATSPLTREEAAALILTGALTLVGSALTVIPLYLLARAGGSPARAWAAATLWPLVPATILFQPTADTAFPLLSVAAMAAAAWARQSGRGVGAVLLALGSGVILAVGMQLTLAYLAVGAVVAIILLGTSGAASWTRRLGLVGITGLGFLATTATWWAATSANPLAIWWTNQAHHAHFYRDYPRSRVAWAGVNLVESAVAVGLASAIWASLAFLRPRSVPASTWGSLALLVILTISGRSLSEVARLWLPMYPPMLLASATAWERWGAGPASLAWTVGLLGVQVLWLQAMIQVVYPI